MELLCIGEYVLKPSLVEMYRLEKIGGTVNEYCITLYLKNGSIVQESIDNKDELERITIQLEEALNLK